MTWEKCGACPKCGGPIWAKGSLEVGKDEPPETRFSCGCRFQQQLSPALQPYQPLQPSPSSWPHYPPPWKFVEIGDPKPGDVTYTITDNSKGQTVRWHKVQ